MLFSDETSFHNNGDFNRHYYSDVNPFWLRRIDNQHQWRVNAWCEILDGQIIIGPHFFNANLNGAMYLQFLQTDLQELMEDVNLQSLRGIWFQHDGVPAHCAGVRDYLNERFSQRWIGRNGFIRWPTRLNTVRLFFMGLRERDCFCYRANNSR